MDLTFGKEELAFQREVRDWLKDNFTPEMQGELKVSRNAYLPKEKLIDWQKRLANKGWLCTGWPKEFGGPGFTTPAEPSADARFMAGGVGIADAGRDSASQQRREV